MKFLESAHKADILLINNDRLIQKSLYEMLSRHGYKVDIANSADSAISRLSKKHFQVILTDVSDEADNIEALEAVKEKSNSSEIIILASYSDIELAVKSIKFGAFDYLVRPVEDEKILSTIERAIANIPIETPKKRPAKKPVEKDEDLYYGLVGCHDGLSEICELVERIASAKATVLMRGDSGTGKRLIAHAIHKADKKRRNKAFIELSCGALPRDIIESELFGHIKGAFTGAINDRKGRFELAHGGTILLDDIDALPLDLQVKLLRVLQQREFERVGDHKTMKIDTRVIASTNQDIEKLVNDKQFREDLYYRLNVISINVPPLRERKEDLPLLVDHFINLYAKENHKEIKSLSEEILGILKAYNWPGNVRELENIIERAVILDTDGIIDIKDLPEILINRSAALTLDPNNINSHILKDALKEPEKGHILRILKEVGWNKKKAAVKLGINRTTLYNKLRKYNIFVHNNEE
ncbi:sigma-54 dependent transcriptional regulator [Omnitrophica bacterium]|nr:sigma-54 dependent transcriptional regulator [Candidatus Omnitrophota bacterium]